MLGKIPGYDPKATAGDCTYDAEAAQLALDFFPECLSHVKGDLAGTPLTLAPWEVSIIANTFGWKRPDGTRRYREVFIYVPRKNGKTTLIAGIVALMLFCDGEPGAEIYSAAADREQATLVFDQTKGMILNEPELDNRCEIYKKSIVLKDSVSAYKAISAEANTKHGYNTSCVVVDELHAQPNRDLVDVLLTSTGSRSQPLVIYITTADYNRESICNEKYDYACKVRDGVIDDPSFLPVIYEASLDDDWTDPKVWAKANPNMGESVGEDYLRRECQRAKETPTYENTFKRLHLNIITESDVKWLPSEKWKLCGGDLRELHGCECYAGLDLSSTGDCTSLVLMFPWDDGSYDLLPFFWIPSDSAYKRERKDKVPYVTWARQGLIEMTPGNVIDYDFIRRKINELHEIYNIKEVALDRWASTQITIQLGGDGFTVVPFGQGYASMSAPCKEFEKLVLSGKLRHADNPVMKWMISNTSVEMDAAGNLKPSKDKSTEKIDGVVSSIMGLGRAMAKEIPVQVGITLI